MRSSRSSGSSTLATDGPPGLRSLCAIDTYRTAVPSVFRRDDVRRYTPTPWPPMTRTGNPSTAETCTYTSRALRTAATRRPAATPQQPDSCAHQLRNPGSTEGPRVVSEATGWQREAASVLFDLPGYRVVDAVDRPGQLRLVTVASTAREAACPACGVLSERVHQRRGQRLADVSVAGPVEVVLVRRRFACAEPLCQADVRIGHRRGAAAGPG